MTIIIVWLWRLLDQYRSMIDNIIELFCSIVDIDSGCLFVCSPILKLNRKQVIIGNFEVAYDFITEEYPSEFQRYQNKIRFPTTTLSTHSSTLYARIFQNFLNDSNPPIKKNVGDNQNADFSAFSGPICYYKKI